MRKPNDQVAELELTHVERSTFKTMPDNNGTLRQMQGDIDLK